MIKLVEKVAAGFLTGGLTDHGTYKVDDWPTSCVQNSAGCMMQGFLISFLRLCANKHPLFDVVHDGVQNGVRLQRSVVLRHLSVKN